MDRHLNGLFVPESWWVRAEDHLIVPHEVPVRITPVYSVVTVSTAGPRYDQATLKLKNVTNVMCEELVARIHAFNIIWFADQEQTVNDGCRK